MLSNTSTITAKTSMFDDIVQQRTFLEQIGKKLSIKKPEDWYSITNIAVLKEGGSDLLSKYNDSLINILTTIYPEYPR